jgi:hypothetical protein
VGDLDNDGRLDVVTNDLDGSPQILHNEFPNAGHWLLVKLRGDRKNRDAVGAVVTFRTGTVTQSRVVSSGTSYLSQDDLRQHFGLGAAKKIDVLEIRWPDGKVTKREGVAADQILVVEKPGS